MHENSHGRITKVNIDADLVVYTLNVSALYVAHFVVNGLSRRSHCFGRRRSLLLSRRRS
ncbi:hypothetical protein [Nostoc sp. MS1]|uniref:hypothetical protein n=1 Tax=Nostoc sp. MS1 TaxID=2764711 RepID=UPI001CC5D3CF|nr:hypothetical protein [Nostoc sp. MS1]